VVSIYVTEDVERSSTACVSITKGINGCGRKIGTGEEGMVWRGGTNEMSGREERRGRGGCRKEDAMLTFRESP
jgi:hypothetical protein